ncbi:hypothetical protein BC629DRAFT_1600062 [Irpex lacteus]|nr:hypothetical protein BC629DRAFT_1600062 [Irpex lacteus]
MSRVASYRLPYISDLRGRTLLPLYSLQIFSSLQSPYGDYCDDIGIHAVLRDKSRTLSTYSIHEEVSASLGKISTKASRYLPDVILPLSGDLFSMAGLMHITPALNRTIYYYVENAKLSADLPTKLSLSTFVGEAIYSAVSVGVFGEQFPLSTFPDFEAIDTNFTNIISKLPFLSRSATSAREHMRVEVAAYIDNAGPEYPQLTKDDRDALKVTYIWGLHSSTIRTAFWLFAYLLNDQHALNLVRDEIDKTVAAEFKDMDSLLDARPARWIALVCLSHLCGEGGPSFVHRRDVPSAERRVRDSEHPDDAPLREQHLRQPVQFRVDRFLVKEGKKGPYLPGAPVNTYARGDTWRCTPSRYSLFWCCAR